MLVSSSFSLFSASSQYHLPTPDPLWMDVGPLARAGFSLALLLTVPRFPGSLQAWKPSQ